MAREKVKVIKNGSFGGLYFITYIGAAAYFLDHSQGFWPSIGALLQALVWPGFVVYHVLTLLHV